MRQNYAEYAELCEAVMSTSDKIQSVAVINKLGRPVEKMSRPGSSEMFPDKNSELLYMQCVLQVSMGRDFDDRYGPINYHVLERANAVMLTFPIDDHVVFLAASKSAGPISLAKKVSSIINQSIKDSMTVKESEMLVDA